VSALVLYGRKRYARVLNAYLEANLARNGGVLHEVVFFMLCLPIPLPHCAAVALSFQDAAHQRS
jgi:hypothetical protein